MAKGYKHSPRPKNKGTKRLFENPILEALSRTHIAVPVTLYLLIAVSFCWYSLVYTNMTNGWILTLFFLGMFAFTFVEYWVHRKVYHMEPDTPIKEKIQYTMHGIHHEYPKDRTRLAMPPLLAIVVAMVLFAIFFVLLGEASYAFFPGFMAGYAGYLTIHFCVHAYDPPNNFFKQLWVNHAIHHYKDGEMMLGVSSPLWDHVFGTMIRKDPKLNKKAVEEAL